MARRTPDTPRGFLLVQVDALSWQTLLFAMRRRRLRFLTRLFKGRHQRHGFDVTPLRPGVPATTPKVQAELLYGARQRFPGFRFLNRASGETTYFGNLFEVARIERNQFAGRFGILENSGASYFNIFDGGADRATFSSAGVGAGSLFPTKDGRLARVAYRCKLALWALITMPRVIYRTTAEAARETYDILRDFKNHELHRGSFSYVIRSLANVLASELTLAAVGHELREGTRHLFVNFIGYDKAAHLRGPRHAYALWSLSLVDRDLKRLHRLARRARRCSYDFYIMSDHGMAPSRPIAEHAGRPFEELLEEALADQSPPAPALRLRATGNLAHLYLGAGESPLLDGEVAQLVPLLKETLAESRYVAWWVSRSPYNGLFYHRGAAVAHVLRDSPPPAGLDAPLLADLFALLDLPDSGDLVLFAAREEGLVWNFLDEYGCHGGNEPEEQDAFVIHPRRAFGQRLGLTPLDLFQHFRDTYHN
ncbi:MAG: hypothetical protein CMJ87_12315 [Planctomycetes bacterium]|jgi:hypothetical protein|nr:hypothetical protein [Planctomycetota bacterium]MDP6518271.1 alkaline phosphatase family protein [Planctomycetota bacterium]